MRKIISLILLLCFTFSLFACDDENGSGSYSPSEKDARFYVPTEQKIYDEDGTLLYTRYFDFDKNGFLCKVDTISTGMRGKDDYRETVSIVNDFDSKRIVLTQNIEVTVEGSDDAYNAKYTWSFDTEMNVISVKYFSQGQEYSEEYDVKLDKFIWLQDDGTFPSIEGADYPTPIAKMERSEESEAPSKLLITYSDETLVGNAYVNKIKDDLAIEYGEELAEFAETETYVAYYTLWGAIAEKQGDTATTVLKYENGTVAEEIKWKNATSEEFVSFHLLDWDWFNGGALDFTAFRYMYRLQPPARPAS